MVYGNPIVYWFLKINLFFVLLICGYLISNGKKRDSRYWKISAFAIICYSLEMGLRWGRSYDYRHYYQDLTGKLYQNYSDVLYLTWVDFFKFTGLPYWVAFIFYSAILIIAFIVLLQKYPKAAIWALPLFLLIPSGADNHVRQFFSVSFGILGFFYYLKRKWIVTIILFVCCVTIHFGNLFFIFVVLFFDKFKFYGISKNPYLLMALYTILFFIWDSEWMSRVADYLTKLNVGIDRAQSYLEHADYWLSDESNIYNKTGIKRGVSKLYFLILKLVVNNGIIYYGCKTFRWNKNFSVYFWSVILILFIGVIGGNKEIFYRFIAPLQLFEALFIGIIWYSCRMRTIYEKYIFLVLGIYYFGWTMYFRNMLVQSPLGYAYIWDL